MSTKLRSSSAPIPATMANPNKTNRACTDSSQTVRRPLPSIRHRPPARMRQNRDSSRRFRDRRRCVRPGAARARGKDPASTGPRTRGTDSESGDQRCRPADRGSGSSGGEARTLNLAVNSRLLCRLSYPGKCASAAFGPGAASEDISRFFAYRRTYPVTLGHAHTNQARTRRRVRRRLLLRGEGGTRALRAAAAGPRRGAARPSGRQDPSARRAERGAGQLSSR